MWFCLPSSNTCLIQTIHCSRPQKRPALKPPQTLYKVKYNEIGTELEGAINMTYTVPWAQNEYICRRLIALMINIRDSVPGAERSNPRSLRHSLKFIRPVWRTEVVASMCPNTENISSIFGLSAFPYKQIQVFEQIGFHAYWFVLAVPGEIVFWLTTRMFESSCQNSIEHKHYVTVLMFAVGRRSIVRRRSFFMCFFLF